MGRASKRKKARRLAGHAAGRARTLRSAAGAPQWPDGSLGGRFFGVREVAQAQAASAVGRLDLMATAVDPVQWPVAVSALIRAVVFDGLQPDHPDVGAVLDVLAPVAEAELAYEAALERWYAEWADCEENKPEFPDLDGPVFLLGGCALVDAIAAVVGNDPLDEVLGVLPPVSRDAGWLWSAEGELRRCGGPGK